MEIKNYVEGKLKINNREYDVKDCELKQSDLKFYTDNPRVYSALRSFDGEPPTQHEIEKHMCAMDRVRELVLAIKGNGGLINPLIVREGDLAVLEGNSRLAAYRILAKNDPVKWGTVKCKVLPENIDDTAIASLLGTYHIVGTKDWSPYEQAGFLYRRKRDSKKPIEIIAKELGIAKSTAVNYIKVFEYMLEQKDLEPDRWSYYEEFLKNRPIQKAIKDSPELEKIVISQIKSREIETAADVRKLGKIASAKSRNAKRVLEKYKKGEIDLYTGYGEVQESGTFDKIFNEVRNFKEYISGDDFKDNVNDSAKKGDIIFDLKKIKQKISSILGIIDDKSK